jgi:hypothetical protein
MDNISLSHWSAAVLSAPSITSVEQLDHPFFKPRGFWVSVDGDLDWQEWCESEMPSWVTKKAQHTVTLSERANILRLSSAGEVSRFHEDHRSFMDLINWNGVARKYDGIIIAPYQRAHRLNGAASNWYYGWDCASGCIWNASAIASIIPVLAKQEAAA